MLHFAKFSLGFFVAFLLVVPAAQAADQCVGGDDACSVRIAQAAEPAQVSPTAPTPSNSNSAGQGQVLVNPLRAGSIPELLAIVLQGLVQIGSIILVLMLVWVGFQFVVAQGSEEKIRDARGALMWTVIGGLVLLGAQAIATLIQATVNAL